MAGAIDYADLLTRLGSSTFTTLREAQAAALNFYAADHTTTRELAIELPTGAGKSLIALLICEAWRQEDRSVMILTGNKTLARQMEREGGMLGIDVVLFEGGASSISLPQRRRYRRANAVGIANYWVLFNQSPTLDSADLLVIDDAHLAEGALDSLYSVEIDRFAHPALFQALVSELAARFPDYATFQDVLDDRPPTGGTELLSFLDQAAAAEDIRRIIDNGAELLTDADLRFRWGRARERLHEANIYCSTRSIWIRPYVYPLGDNAQYADPAQRIYMSATIGDPADLARRLGTAPITRMELPAGQTAHTLGRRLLVMNPDETEDIPGRLEEAILAALAVQPKSVWLCASRSDAEHYRSIVGPWLQAHELGGHPTWLLSSTGDEIDQFKLAAAGHLFVGGRFDGMDFNADECRLVVLATQPRAINLQEEFASAYLRDAAFLNQRLNQRIVQALGRCNRAEDDFAVYVLADRRFATHFSQEARRRGLPASVQAEIDVAENHTELDSPSLAQAVTDFLSEDFDQFDRELAEAAAGLPAPGAPEAGDDSSGEVTGWLELYGRQDYGAAEHLFDQRQRVLGDRGQRELGAFVQWCQAKAAFLEGRRGDPAAATRALQTLEAAIERGGARSSWFNRLRSSLHRYRHEGAAAASVTRDDYAAVMLQRFDDLLDRIGSGGRLEKWRARLVTQLASVSHDEYAQGLETLGWALGYEATRPTYGASTDCRWRGVFGNQLELITFEAKIEHSTDSKIDAHAVGQANNQRNRAIAQFGERGYSVRGTDRHAHGGNGAVSSIEHRRNQSDP